MIQRLTLLAATAALLIGLTAPMARAQEEDEEPGFDEQESGAKEGGHAIDNKTEVAKERPMTGPGSIPPEAYAILTPFWGSMLAGDYGGAAYSVWPEDDDRESGANFSWLAPIDGPAESILDQLDERGTPLPMVGEPGSEVTVAGAAPTPPPESVLDYIDPPAPMLAPTGEQNAVKPAANQAPAPPVTQSKQ